MQASTEEEIAATRMETEVAVHGCPHSCPSPETIGKEEDSAPDFIEFIGERQKIKSRKLASRATWKAF